ncbi:hypothetical protein GCM10008090_09260 [Arenicella chitinivorans]|uniref:Uncharacterized protein n=1 Tax=Arenicella chitinivorans TaxID=1329800 RepID=A0A918VJE7_9GAMM|nr:hypothetical protein [Arenicella chitinivorans]GHA02133.1 hypothetical protein GCM10008090_09260 [Arenicella chitinivorans]
MKLTQQITNLLFELSELECREHTRYLIGDGVTLRNNLIKLFDKTELESAREIIREILQQAGDPWLDLDKLPVAPNMTLFDAQSIDAQNDDFLLTEEEFLELIPANGHFH